jgi:hypothetical protein
VTSAQVSHQLAGAVDALGEQGQLVVVDRGAGRRVWADHRRVRDRDAAVLQHAGCIEKSAPHPQVVLRECGHCSYA